VLELPELKEIFAARNKQAAQSGASVIMGILKDLNVNQDDFHRLLAATANHTAGKVEKGLDVLDHKKATEEIAVFGLMMFILGHDLRARRDSDG
jgi:hypothetical protein